MKQLVLGMLIGASAAVSAENTSDPIRDVPPSELQMKVMQGRLDAAVSIAVAETLKNEAAVPRSTQSSIAYSSSHADILTAAFIEAKQPDCLHSDGLKRQPTFLLTGLLALPFIAVAKVRGKCS